MFVLLASFAAAQILNLPQVTVNVSTCEKEIEVESKEFDVKCLGTTQKVEDMLGQFCKSECITTYDKYVNKIKSVCDLTPQDLTVLEEDVKDFNNSQKSICSNEVNIIATATNTAPGVTATGTVAPRTTVAQRTSAPVITSIAASKTQGSGSYPTTAAANAFPTTKSSAEKLSIGILSLLMFL
jgi:hypothetical protein